MSRKIRTCCPVVIPKRFSGVFCSNSFQKSPRGCQLSASPGWYLNLPSLFTSLNLRRQGISRPLPGIPFHNGKPSEFPDNPSGAGDLRQPFRGCNKESGPQSAPCTHRQEEGTSPVRKATSPCGIMVGCYFLALFEILCCYLK